LILILSWCLYGFSIIIIIKLVGENGEEFLTYWIDKWFNSNNKKNMENNIIFREKKGNQTPTKGILKNNKMRKPIKSSRQNDDLFYFIITCIV
jgi:hypothetical protein